MSLKNPYMPHTYGLRSWEDGEGGMRGSYCYYKWFWLRNYLRFLINQPKLIYLKWFVNFSVRWITVSFIVRLVHNMICGTYS